MFVLSFATLALAVVSSSALVIPRSSSQCPQKQPPQGWFTNILEDYEQYHIRYLALDCEAHHNSTFFNTCCHPLLKTQSLSDRPAECTPSAQAVAAVCDSTTTTSVAVPATTSTATPTATPTSTESVVTSTPITTTSSSTTSTTKKATSSSSSSSTEKATSSATPIKSASSSLASSVASAVQTFTGGVATFFFQKGNAGACGTVHSDQDFIAAIDQTRYGNSGVASSLCGKQVLITNTNTKKTVTVTIADDCPTCDNENSIDLSLGAFLEIGTQEEGEVPISWQFL